ncbi:hypothetical protein [Herpetosiphon giganteus]|uniref:hypothetical protein n=1 Tax=Herpetosiphon giganteus TaxID=2029754 RepID=UPI00195DEA2E|nr:hypothetical protein [Herpetosiphon giganteus]MBM7842272.1 hypothetical protein [Herpetosiphon giganteus]
MPDNSVYSASNIQLPSNLNQIQLRRENVGMYYGGNDGTAIQGLLIEYIDFLLTKQHAQRIQITSLPEASFIVQDFGATLESVADCGLPTAELLHLFGAAQHCTIDLHHDGQHYQLSYNGELTVPAVQQLGSSQANYRSIHFVPNHAIFIQRASSIHQLLGSLRGLATLFAGCRIEVIDQLHATINHLFYPNGLRDYLDELIYNNLNPQPYLEFEAANEHVHIKLGLQFSYFSQIEQCLLRYRHVPFDPSYRQAILIGLAAGLTTYGHAHQKIAVNQAIEPTQIRNFGCLIVLAQLATSLQDAGRRPSNPSLIAAAIQQLVQQQLPEQLACLSASEIDQLVMW